MDTMDTIVYTTTTGDAPRTFEPEVVADPWGVVCCLGQDGITSTSSCNRIALASTGAWCPWCHPGFPESEWNGD